MDDVIDVLFTAVCAIFGCAGLGFSPQSDVVERSPPDLSFIDLPFQHCHVPPSKVAALPPADKCMLKSLTARCTQSDDCLVQCLVSKDGPQIGGGCWHACFETKFNLAKWSPPSGAERCRKLGHTNGS